jgi:transcriptional regulator with XRE-family HTH domain
MTQRQAARSVRRAMDNLRTAREAAGLTPEELAERVGLAVEDVRRLEEGDLFEVDLGLVVRYADAIGKRAVVQIAD